VLATDPDLSGPTATFTIKNKQFTAQTLHVTVHALNAVRYNIEFSIPTE
jgi:hypothetical protein